MDFPEGQFDKINLKQNSPVKKKLLNKDITGKQKNALQRQPRIKTSN